MSPPIDIAQTEVEKIVKTGWEVLIDGELASVEVPFGPSEQQDPQIAGVSAMSSEDNSLFFIATAGDELARGIASEFFRIPPEDVDTQQAHEAMAELVNVFAGNAGAVAPDAMEVKTPLTAVGNDLRPLYADRTLLYQGVYTTGSHLLEVRLCGSDSLWTE